MGTRTELLLRVELDEDLPDEVVVILDAYARDEAGSLEYLPEHAFFKTRGWDRALWHRDFATPTARDSVQFWMDEIDNPDQWRLLVHCCSKNAEKAFEKFLDWILPFVDGAPGAFLGYLLEDDRDALRLIYAPPAPSDESVYLTVSSFSSESHTNSNQLR